MKRLFIAFLTLSLLQADELKRIESIINDIAKLRVEYEECREALESKTLLKAQTTNSYDCKKHEETIKLLRSKNTFLDKNLKEKAQIVKNNQNESEKYKKELKTKEKEIEALKKKLTLLEKQDKKEPKVVIKEIIKEVIVEKKIDQKDENIFPVLMPKNTNVKKENLEIKEIEEETKPTTYRLKKDSRVFNKIGGKKIYLWEKGRSFTSNIKTQNFIKITGYFVDKKWQRAKEELWIEKEDAFER